MVWSGRPGRRVVALAALLAVPGLVYPLWRASLPTNETLATPPTPAYRPAKGGELRVMTLNLAHGRGLAAHQLLLGRSAIAANLSHVAALLAGADVELVALQEADGPSVWSGHFDQVESLRQAAGFAHAYRGTHVTGVWPWRVDYGTALLARVPLTAPRTAAFDEAVWDTKGWVSATLAPPSLGGAPVEVVSLHLDFASAEVRARQVQQLIAALGGERRAMIVLGDLNCTWDELGCAPALAAGLDLSTWEPAGGTPTFPVDAAVRRIDWIFTSPHFTVVEQQTLSAPVSDHRAVVARLRWRGGRPGPDHPRDASRLSPMNKRSSASSR